MRKVCARFMLHKRRETSNGSGMGSALLELPRRDLPRLTAPLGHARYPPPSVPPLEDGLPETLIRESEVAVLCDTLAATMSLLGAAPPHGEPEDAGDNEALYVMFLAEGGGTLPVLERSKRKGKAKRKRVPAKERRRLASMVSGTGSS